MVEQNGAQSKTQIKSGPAPIWSESIVFDITDIEKPLVVEMRSVRDRRIVIQKAFDFDTIRRQQQNQDCECYGLDQENLVVRIQFLYSKVKMLLERISEFENFLIEHF